MDVLTAAAELEVAPETIRRDLRQMESAGRLQRVHGGAVPIRSQPVSAPTVGGSPYAQLGHQVWERLPRTGTLLIGAGPPALGLVEAIAATPPDTGELTVVTNSLEAALLLSGVATLSVYTVGGSVSPRTYGQEGDWAITELNRLRVDVTVLCPAGVTATDGLTADTAACAAICRAQTLAGRRVIALADAAAIGATAFEQFATIDEIDELVVAGTVQYHQVQPLVDHGTAVRLVPT